jgi:hypothetical protein
MNVKFLSTTYRPTEEKLRELQKMQEHIHYSRTEYLFQIRNDSPRMQAARKAELHRMFRNRWEVHTNEEFTDLQESATEL